MINRHSILRIPFQDLPTDPSKDELLPYRERAVTSLPHGLAWVGSTWKLARNETGKFSFHKSLQVLLEQQRQGQLLYEGTPVERDWLQGFILYFTHSPRGEILAKSHKQSDSNGWRYAASIPLILSAFKQYRNIGYEEWDWQELFSDDPKVQNSVRAWVDADFIEIVKYRYSSRVEFSVEDLLEFRDYTNAKKRALTAITTVYSTDPDFKALPRLVKLMLLQLWIYHPTIRHPLAVTNLDNFDEPAPLLVNSDVMAEPDPWGLVTESTTVKTRAEYWLEQEQIRALRETTKAIKAEKAKTGRDTSDIPWDV